MAAMGAAEQGLLLRHRAAVGGGQQRGAAVRLIPATEQGLHRLVGLAGRRPGLSAGMGLRRIGRIGQQLVGADALAQLAPRGLEIAVVLACVSGQHEQIALRRRAGAGGVGNAAGDVASAAEAEVRFHPGGEEVLRRRETAAGNVAAAAGATRCSRRAAVIAAAGCQAQTSQYQQQRTADPHLHPVSSLQPATPSGIGSG